MQLTKKMGKIKEIFDFKRKNTAMAHLLCKMRRNRVFYS